MNIFVNKSYVKLLLFIILFIQNKLYIFGEESHSDINSQNDNLNNKSSGIEVIISPIKFPTIQKLFDWMCNFSEFNKRCEENFSLFSKSIPTNEDFELHHLILSSISASIQCVDLLKQICYLYSSSNNNNSNLFSELLTINIDNLLNNCLNNNKDIIVNSYLELYSMNFQGIYSSLLLEGIELTLYLYDNLWLLYSTLLGYKSYILQTIENLNQFISNNADTLSQLSSLKELSSIEKLKSNILNQQQKEYQLSLKLLELMLSLFSGDYSVIKQIEELEKKVVEDNMKLISELEISLKNINEANKKLDINSKQYSDNNSLISDINKELSRRKNVLSSQISGSTFYCQKFDESLSKIYLELSNTKSLSKES